MEKPLTFLLSNHQKSVVASQEPHARNSCLPNDVTDPSILKSAYLP